MALHINRLTGFLNIGNIIIENVNDLISIINEKKEIEYVNYHPHFTLLGYKKDELIGNNFLNIVHIDDVELLNDAIEKGFKLGDVTQKIRLKRKIGDFIWIELKGKLIKDDNEIRNEFININKSIPVPIHYLSPNDLVTLCYDQLSKEFPVEERYSLTDQIRRASRSICSNLGGSAP